jgi:hypothetical protein
VKHIASLLWLLPASPAAMASGQPMSKQSILNL